MQNLAITLLNEVIYHCNQEKEAVETLEKVCYYNRRELINTINWCLDCLKENFDLPLK